MDQSCQAGDVRRLLVDLGGDHVEGLEHVVGACSVPGLRLEILS